MPHSGAQDQKRKLKSAVNNVTCDDHIVLTCAFIFQLQDYPVHELVTKHAYNINIE